MELEGGAYLRLLLLGGRDHGGVGAGVEVIGR